VNRPDPLLGTPIDTIIGDNMARLRRREEPKLPQTDVAFALTELTGTNWEQQTVSLAENGQRPFRVVDLFMIARLFAVSPIRLLKPYRPSATVRNGTDHPWVDAIKIGTLQFWPADFLNEFILDPRDGDSSAANWKDGWPDRIGQPLHDWIGQLREAVEAADNEPLDLDALVLASWEHTQRSIEQQRREHT